MTDEREEYKPSTRDRLFRRRADRIANIVRIVLVVIILAFSLYMVLR